MYVVSEHICHQIVRVVLVAQHDIIVHDEHLITHYRFSEEIHVRHERIVMHEYELVHSVQNQQLQ